MERTIISFTTIPERIKILPKFLDSLRAQTVKASVIYAQIPKETKSGKSYDIAKIREVIEPYSDINVVINVVEDDEGPITKLVPVLDLERDPGTNIVVMDDDVSYGDGILERLLQNKDLGAIGFAGRIFGAKNRTLNYLDNQSTVRKVDIIEATRSVLYKRKLFPATSKQFISWLHELPDLCKFNDDIIISAWLHSVGQPRYLLPFKNLNVKHDARGSPELRTHNLKGRNVDIYLLLYNLGYLRLPLDNFPPIRTVNK
jgi:hypothetical protein